MSFYFLNSPENLTKEQVGGKGYYLHQMAQDELPIPEAAFLSTDLWKEYRKNPEKTIQKLKKDVIPQLVEYFKNSNNGQMPLVSVRSAGAVSMPGMMDTVLNVGVNQKFFKDLGVPTDDAPKKGKGKKKQESSEEFAADVYSRFLTMYGDTVLGMSKDVFPRHQKFNSIADVQVHFEALYKKHKQDLPSQKPEEQILQCVLAVFNSWDNDRAILYRKLNNIDNNSGTAVVIQRMVFGNKNDMSATGVLFSRNPSNGTDVMTGEYLVNAQGEDVVSGSHTPLNLDELKEDFPDAFDQLQSISKRLEGKYKQMQDIEFTIEDGKVFILQARTAKCAPMAKLKMLIDMYQGRDISAQEVLDNLSLKDYMDLNIKQVDPAYEKPADGTGLAASMGAISGRVVFGPSTKYKDDPTIFVAKETTPDDLEAIQLSTGILTASGGATSHAAVVARGMGKICVVGCTDVKMDAKNESATIGGVKVQSGDWITVDANQGKVWVGQDVPIVDAQNSQVFWDLEDLVIDANPGWTRITSKVDELVQGKKTYFLTYTFDDKDEDFMEEEFGDTVKYLTGTLDMTGKLDYLQQKYANQFLFADITAKTVFERKKDMLIKILSDQYDVQYDFDVYLGPYEEKYGPELRRLGLKIKSSDDVSFDPKNLSASLVVTQRYTKDIPNEKMAISSKNALLGVLK